MDGKKILIVDDEQEIVKLIKRRVEADGYQVFTANDGTEALEKAEKENPDLILLDIKMAKMDGYTAFRNLKKNEQTKSIPVIVVSAYDKMKDMFELEGVSDFIVKPFDGQDLLARIAKVLKREK